LTLFPPHFTGNIRILPTVTTGIRFVTLFIFIPFVLNRICFFLTKNTVPIDAQHQSVKIEPTLPKVVYSQAQLVSF